jgi:hypothetical protein
MYAAGGWIVLGALALPWVLLIAIRVIRAARDPDRWDGGGYHGGVFSQRYVEKQFERPRDERDLL